jgi:hypothetical protein
MWGVIAMAIFHTEKGIIYGHVSSTDEKGKWIPRGWDLLWV